MSQGCGVEIAMNGTSIGEVSTEADFALPARLGDGRCCVCAEIWQRASLSANANGVISVG